MSLSLVPRQVSYVSILPAFELLGSSWDILVQPSLLWPPQLVFADAASLLKKLLFFFFFSEKHFYFISKRGVYVCVCVCVCVQESECMCLADGQPTMTAL